MSELSIFIDESGDVGEYRHHSPYYIITMVFHDQDDDITQYIKALDSELDNLGFLQFAEAVHVLERERDNASLRQTVIFAHTPKPLPSGRILKKLTFRFPLLYGEEEITGIGWDKVNHVETVLLLVFP